MEIEGVKYINPNRIADGFQGFPQCEVCQCYPECRNDCPKHLECVRRLPEYAERVFGSNKDTWPADVRAAWDANGYLTWSEEWARLTPEHRALIEQAGKPAKRWWQFWR